ncbi:MAG: thiaminase II [Anaerolineales bacterium]|nr:thiaminase II [Anaerolineales bacterium]
MSSFTQDLIDKAEPYMQAQIKKPFLLGLVHGDLPLEAFQYWLKVDYPYLHNFVKVCALGVLKATDPRDITIMMTHIDGIQREMVDHEKHAARTGVSREELLAYPMGPLKYSYTRHQLASAYDGDIGDVQAAILACQWGYPEAVYRLLQTHTLAPDNPYLEWFDFHGDPANREALAESIELLDRQADQATPAQRDRYARVFRLSVQHETMLWDEYYNRVEWENYPGL